jgi:hypothetical protein
MTATDLRFPIGRFTPPATMRAEDRASWLRDLGELPTLLRRAVEGLTPEQLDTPYREGGWTARQVVHHLADSHINACIRFRLALTEDAPTIRPYDEAKWAELHDARSAPAEYSLVLLEALHARWIVLLSQLNDADWARTFRHPELDRVFTLHETLGLYAWHGRHHVAHIERAHADS